mmetsp:Transcript_5634/g.13431  ORF Transcript_5634/g.13431 Transcript_5634/m.13431 type:complete len:192 (-) Transcript_5634:47-622(-)
MFAQVGRGVRRAAQPLGRLAQAPVAGGFADASACRALSTMGGGFSDARGSTASPRPDREDGPVSLVRWAKYGKTLKPEDVGSLLAYGKLSAESAAAEPAVVAPEAPGKLPTVRPRIKLNDALGDVPVSEIVYTNIALLSRFVTETGAMLPRRRTGITALKQRKLGNAIKVARHMNLLPYISKLPQHYDARP